MGSYPIGSVFKIILATGAIEENLISGHTEYTCNGSFGRGRLAPLKCTSAHYTVELSRAIERSCNVYFFNVGLLMGPKRLKKWAEKLGFGKRTSTDIGEARGRFPLAVGSSETLNLAIGQGRMLCTPLQVARTMGCVALSGKLAETRFSLEKPIRVTKINLHPDRINIIRWGMRDVIYGRRGTARRTARVDGLIYAGKTGTAQTIRKDIYHAWFAGFAPFKSSRLSFACVIENTRGHGGTGAAPVIKRIFDRMMNDPELKHYVTGGQS